jgi:hypothetical protein
MGWVAATPPAGTHPLLVEHWSLIRDCAIGGVFGVDGRSVLEQFYVSLGFNVKMEVHASITTANFCSMMFDIDELVVMPNPMKKIMNFGWIDPKFHGAGIKTKDKLLKGKAISLLAESRGVPVLQTLALRVIYLTHRVKAKFADSWTRDKFEDNPNLEPLPVSTHSRILFEELHGFGIDEQIELENYFSKIMIEPIDHPYITCRYSLDQIDCWNRYHHDDTIDDDPYVAPLRLHD